MGQTPPLRSCTLPDRTKTKNAFNWLQVDVEVDTAPVRTFQEKEPMQGSEVAEFDCRKCRPGCVNAHCSGAREYEASRDAGS